MTAPRRPLAGRTVLVVGASDPVGSSAALHVAARGADVIVADPDVPSAILVAGLIAATGSVGRVLEVAAPPLAGAALARAATAALRAPTDAVLAALAFGDAAALEAARAALVAALPGARVLTGERAPADGAKAGGRRIADALTSPPPVR